LKNRRILEEMASAAELTKNDVVLEVGPGTGNLTEILAERAKKVVAVEKDRDLIPILREKFETSKNVEIVEGDILKITKSEIRNPKQFPKFKIPKNYKIVANIPYYITSRFLRLFLSNTKCLTSLMVLMVQREVAERICAKPPRMNLLALSVQAYAKPEIIRRVPREQFFPQPKVDSAIIKAIPLIPLTLRETKKNSLEKILSIARLAFQQKRKMLRQSIGKKIALPPKYQTKRPEELSLDDWLQILNKKS